MKSIYWKSVCTLVLFLLYGCTNDKMPTESRLLYQPDLAVPITDDVDSLRICLWRNDKSAAYSIAFDDATRASHYLVSAPELEARGMRGTFNLNTKDIIDWEPWQQLFDRGHELASHGWSHVRMGELDEVALHLEFSRAKSDMLRHTKGLKEVPSFTFPMGSASSLPRAIALQYHRSARVGGGVNAARLSQEELSRVKGIGVYPPYEMSRFEPYIHETIASGGWVLVYFHSVSAAGESGETMIPLSLFKEHLDFIEARAESLWFATQGEVAAYICARAETELIYTIRDGNIVEVLLNAQALREQEATLSVLVPKPQEWFDHDIRIETAGVLLKEFKASSAPQMVCDLPVNQTVWIWARK